VKNKLPVALSQGTFLFPCAFSRQNRDEEEKRQEINCNVKSKNFKRHVISPDVFLIDTQIECHNHKSVTKLALNTWDKRQRRKSEVRRGRWEGRVRSRLERNRVGVTTPGGDLDT
jgi:hypothetical protein